jgi:hypothetical protein
MSMPTTLEINGTTYASVEGDAMAGAFADMDDHKQARFFNDLGAIAKLWRSDYKYGEKQWCAMAEHLDENGKAVLLAMAQFLKPNFQVGAA